MRVVYRSHLLVAAALLTGSWMLPDVASAQAATAAKTLTACRAQRQAAALAILLAPGGPYERALLQLKQQEAAANVLAHAFLFGEGNWARLSEEAKAGLAALGEQTFTDVLPAGGNFEEIDGVSVSGMAGRVLSPVETADLWTRARVLKLVSGDQPLTEEAVRTLIAGHETGTTPAGATSFEDLAAKVRVAQLLGGMETTQTEDAIRLGLMGNYQGVIQDVFEVPEGEAEARRIVANMRVEDASRITPPFVRMYRKGSATFGATAPVGTAESTIEFEALPNGGTRLIEHFDPSSPCPLAEKGIEWMHDGVIDVETGYEASNRRLNGARDSGQQRCRRIGRR